MHDFRYVTKKQAQPIKDELYQILYMVQDLVRDNFTFSFTSIGSSSRNMITYDAKSNIGFDFDINIEVNDDKLRRTALRRKRHHRNIGEVIRDVLTVDGDDAV